jgi:hypothetical protein
MPAVETARDFSIVKEDGKPAQLLKATVRKVDTPEELARIRKAEQALSTQRSTQTAKELGAASIGARKAEMGLTEVATRRAIARTPWDNVKFVVGSKPFVAIIAFPIALGVGYLISQAIANAIKSSVAKSLNIDETTANYIVWIVGIVVTIVVLFFVWNHMGKVAK